MQSLTRPAILLLLAAISAGAQQTTPDHRLTPGAANFNVTAREVCAVGYAKRHRNVPIEEKRMVYREYGIAYVRGAFVVDHDIPLSLGGSNSIANLWVEPARGGWNSHVKDDLEGFLHDSVCRWHTMSLPEAQRIISGDWVASYKSIFRTEKPLPLFGWGRLGEE